MADDLSHWDFAERFSGYDAAALILGIEPRESGGDEHRVRVVMDRMALDYSEVIKTIRWEMSSFEKSSTCPDELFLSARLEELLWNSHDGDMESIDAWLSNERSSGFHNQEFERKKISLWLRKVGQTSVYQFDRNSANAAELSRKNWPWGDHHTEALGQLEAAGKRFWMNYDSADFTTASTNTVVSEWLQKERKVSKTMADSIASILRADGLPTGPRR